MDNQIKNEIYEQLVKLKKLREVLLNSIAKAPDGSLVIYKNKDDIERFYQNISRTCRKYISLSDNVEIITGLAQKQYDKMLLESVNSDIKACEEFLKYIAEPNYAVIDKISSAKQKFIQPIELSDEEFVKQWYAVPEPKNTFPFDENTKHFTIKKERVRSKTEELEGNLFYADSIHYVYEPAVYFDGSDVPKFADFKLLNLRTRQTFYFESFGIMDDPEYANNAIYKINAYARNGYEFGKNFLYIMESSKYPLDSEYLMHLVDMYLK